MMVITETLSLSRLSSLAASPEPSGKAREGSAAQVLPVIDSFASTPVGPLLTPRQQLMADMESLIGVYLQIFVTSRTAAREHNMYLRESVARMVEREADKMMSAALMQLVGGVAQGAMGVASGCVQIGGAMSTLSSVKNGLKKEGPLMQQESDALKTLQAAEERVKTAKPGDDAADAKIKLDQATTSYEQAKKALLEVKEQLKSVDPRTAGWNGAASVLKGTGDTFESGFKYAAAGEDKGRTLLDALKQYLQSSQQSNQDFERDLAEMNRQLLDQLRTITDRSHQLSMSLGQAV